MENGVFLKVIFLENHGLVTTSDCAEECTKLHIEVNEEIKKYLNLSDFCSDLAMEEIKEEGYFGNECYDTWHGFLGIRHGKLCYVAMKCGFNAMCWTLVALGIYDTIKLDGGGSFILHDVKELEGTSENRRIHNVGVWKG